MAITATLSRPGLNLRQWTIVATADTDAAITIPHGISETPIVFLTPTNQPAGQLSGWAVSGVDATGITLMKSTAVGSGTPGNQATVVAIAPLARVLG